MSSQPDGQRPLQSAGDPSVLLAGLPALRMGDAPACADLPGVAISGSPTVLIGGRPATRVGDQTSRGHMINSGCPTVVLG